MPAVAPAGTRDDLNGPWNRDLVLYRSGDGGKTWSEGGVIVERAGVPNVIRDPGGRMVAVFQWFPFENQAAFDRVAVAFSDNDGQDWSRPAPISVENLPAPLMRPFDPTIVSLPGGGYRLYFTSNERGSQSKPAIYSAVSDDAIHFVFEGVRFAPDAGTVDATVVSFQGMWHLFSHNMMANTGTGFHATSPDGLMFTQLPDVDAGPGHQWIGNALVVGGILRYFGSGREGVWIADSTDGSLWTITGAGPKTGDPAAIVSSDGELLIIAVGGPREDAGPRPF